MSKKNNLEFVHDLVSKVDSRLDDINDNMSVMSDTLIKHDINLALHMKRSDQNEQAIEMLKKHVTAVNAVIAFVGFVAVVATIYSAFKGQ